MISRFIPLGLLCILILFACTTVVTEKEEIIKGLTLDEEINLLLKEHENQPEILLEKLLKLIEPENLTYNSLLAGLELSLARYESAIKRIEAIDGYDNDPDNLEILLITKIKIQEDYNFELNQLLKLYPENTLAKRIQAQKLFQKGDINGARRILIELVEEGNGDSSTYMLLGDITIKEVDSLGLAKKRVLNNREEQRVTNLYKRALNYYLKSENVSSPSYYVKISEIYRKLGNKLEAIKALGMAIKLNPEDPWNYYDRGKLYFYTESMERALADFEKSYEIQPDDFFTNVFLGRIYYRENNSKKALFHYMKVMEENPEYSPAYKDLSVLYFVSGDSVSGINYLIKLYNLGTDRDALLPLYLVNSLIETGRKDDADKILANLVKHENNSTIKGIYSYFMNPDRAGDEVLNNALLLEDQYQRMRLTYYVSCALERGGISSLSEALLTEVADSGVDLESKLARYKLGVDSE